MPDFNLAAMSLTELRDLQKSVAKAISTFEAGHKAVAREKVEMLAKDLGFTLDQVRELLVDEVGVKGQRDLPVGGQETSL